MYLTGFADEAATNLEGQIKATQELGWHNIESRGVNGRNMHDLSDAEFDAAAARLADSGIRVNCFGSAIANWGKKIDEPFDASLAEARRAIPRMQRLGTKLIRIMSFAVRAAEDQMDDERFRRLRTLQMMFTDAGLTPVHENCMNYGGMSWRHTLRMLEQVPGLKLVFDTGNPVFTGDYTQDPPRPMQSAWEFYRQVREFIAYVHIKDGHWDAATQQSVFTYPGEGVADVRRIVTDLLRTGYDAGFSMEPHLAVVHHDPTLTSPDAIRYANYVEYGRRFQVLLRDACRATGRTAPQG